MQLKSKFEVSDLSTYEDSSKYDLLISLGVLHHTNNCLQAIKYISKFGNENSNLFLGLYHRYGRKPF